MIGQLKVESFDRPPDFCEGPGKSQPARERNFGAFSTARDFPGEGRFGPGISVGLAPGVHEGFIGNYEICGMKFQEFAFFSYLFRSMEKRGRGQRRPTARQAGLPRRSFQRRRVGQ
jgi:hypothetical protein